MLCCDRLPHKHGKDRQGFQRWKCPICGKTFSDNPQPKKTGRKPLNNKPMTVAERKRKQRDKKNKSIDMFNEPSEKFKKAVEALADESPGDFLQEDWDTLANVLLAYLWSDNFKDECKEIEYNYLLEEQSNRQEMIQELRGVVAY